MNHVEYDAHGGGQLHCETWIFLLDNVNTLEDLLSANISPKWCLITISMLHNDFQRDCSTGADNNDKCMSVLLVDRVRVGEAFHANSQQIGTFHVCIVNEQLERSCGQLYSQQQRNE